jgi:integrase
VTKDLQPYEPGALEPYGQAANYYAAQNVFEEYHALKAENTLKAHAVTLTAFTQFLHAMIRQTENREPVIGDLMHDPEAWQGMTWGLIKAFITHMLNEGYAIGTVNGRLHTIRQYCELAHKAGVIPADAIVSIRGLKAYSGKEAYHLDGRRETTRIGDKKREPVPITPEQAKIMKQVYLPPDTKRKRVKPWEIRAVDLRDSLMMCVLLDHGLRAIEVTLLNTGSFQGNYLIFFRPKVAGTRYERGKHKLTKATAAAWKAYRPFVAQGDDSPVFVMTGNKGNRLTDKRITPDWLSHRVHQIGKRIGLEGLSAHDCRHYLATLLASDKRTTERKLMQVFGWSSVQTAMRYIRAAEVGNELWDELGMDDD